MDSPVSVSTSRNKHHGFAGRREHRGRLVGTAGITTVGDQPWSNIRRRFTLELSLLYIEPKVSYYPHIIYDKNQLNYTSPSHR